MSPFFSNRSSGTVPQGPPTACRNQAKLSHVLYNNLAMREDEERCKSAFDTFLTIRYQSNDIVWSDGDEPPDCYLNLCGAKFAVEVRQLWDEIQINGDYESEKGFLITVQNFLKHLEKKAIQQGILKGAYSVRYNPIDDFGKKRRRIESSIMEYLRTTQNAPFSREVELLIGRDGFGWYIQKRHSEKRRLSGGPSSSAKFKGEIAEMLCNLLNKALQAKVEKLKRISLPKILLLYDRFPWMDAEEWKQYLPRLSYIDNFHTIFLVSEKSSNSILHSVETSWLNQP